MSLSDPIRRLHRWMSVVFTLAVIVNVVALGIEKAPAWIGLLALVPLAVLQLTGLYLLVLPWLAKPTAGGDG